jgi:hypothetical protein
MLTILPKKAARDALAQLVAADGLFNGCLCRLYVNNINVTDATVIGDLTEATFAGYAASAALTWGTPYNDGDHASVESNRVQFTTTGEPDGQTARGAYLTTAGGSPALLAILPFDGPQSVVEAGDAVIVIPELSIPFSVDHGNIT